VRICGEDMIGIAMALVATAGVGAILVSRRLSEIGWILLATAIGGAVSLIRRHRRERCRARDITLAGVAAHSSKFSDRSDTAASSGRGVPQRARE
jgi:hypothetical protein